MLTFIDAKKLVKFFNSNGCEASFVSEAFKVLFPEMIWGDYTGPARGIINVDILIVADPSNPSIKFDGIPQGDDPDTPMWPFIYNDETDERLPDADPNAL